MRRLPWPFIVIALVALLVAVIASHLGGGGSLAHMIHGR